MGNMVKMARPGDVYKNTFEVQLPLNLKNIYLSQYIAQMATSIALPGDVH